jgi:RNA polymerase sigma-70 factor (ECF subfamily)
MRLPSRSVKDGHAPKVLQAACVLAVQRIDRPVVGVRMQSQIPSNSPNRDCAESGAIPSEDELKRLAQTDRRGAAQALFDRYRERLEFHASGIVKDAQEARDVVQEVFIKAMREPRLFDAEFRTQAWLYRVTRNLCFNIVRDRRRRGGILAGMHQQTERPEDQLERVFHGERQEEMIVAVQQLTDDHRVILMLRYYEDLSYSEIAVRLNIKMGTVMSRLSRARDRLEEVLGHETSTLLQAS